MTPRLQREFESQPCNSTSDAASPIVQSNRSGHIVGQAVEQGTTVHTANHRRKARKVSSPCGIHHKDGQKGDRVLGAEKDLLHIARIV